jgi:hypothetical protein
MNKLRLINGSEVLWMNLKEFDDGMIRGLEVNSALVDQAEEISEEVYIKLSARVGRWDRAVVPDFLLQQDPKWPIAQNTGKPRVPAYNMILCNPDSELHWIYRRFHPDSEEFQNRFHRNHVMIQGASTTATLDEELLDEMMSNEQDWVDRFVLGKWGISGGSIHNVRDESLLCIGEPPLGFKGVQADESFLNTILTKGNLYRVLDHGDYSPTCCLWFASYQNVHICYREYYKPNALISQHRSEISSLSGKESYIKNLCDPAMAKKVMQKYGGNWSQMDEYADPKIEAPPIYFTEADNNELATRNRISEYLRPSANIMHPIKREMGGNKLYFIVRSPDYPNGCYHSVQQLKAQRRMKVGTVDGKEVYSDERDAKIADHGYDPIRYYVADHTASSRETRAKFHPNSFAAVRLQAIWHKKRRGATW